ncbi:hypothetical protein B296_00040836 [Ensete ventricosum]|uniref:Uncharacterized protein n=1 Tax=Ensete ventricosum TaxID=4639 RepID=A0A426YNV5_ENSVE|nr:hypothetical protein B296_00040836 [Ensete ventricosum]
MRRSPPHVPFARYGGVRVSVAEPTRPLQFCPPSPTDPMFLLAIGQGTRTTRTNPNQLRPCRWFYTSRFLPCHDQDRGDARPQIPVGGGDLRLPQGWHVGYASRSGFNCFALLGCFVMLDTVGPELQVVNKSEKAISLEADGYVILTPDQEQEASSELLPINFSGLSKASNFLLRTMLIVALC